jgi:hypothetical protein
MASRTSPIGRSLSTSDHHWCTCRRRLGRALVRTRCHIEAGSGHVPVPRSGRTGGTRENETPGPPNVAVMYVLIKHGVFLDADYRQLHEVAERCPGARRFKAARLPPLVSEQVQSAFLTRCGLGHSRAGAPPPEAFPVQLAPSSERRNPGDGSLAVHLVGEHGDHVVDRVVAVPLL